MTEYEIFHGTLVHSSKQQPMITIPNGGLLLKNGKIDRLFPGSELGDVKAELGIGEDQIHVLGEKEFLMPGFVDTHIHAPQYVIGGKALNLPLLEWLEKYTFPTEARFKDMQFASDVYHRAVSRVLRNGTTCACYFATIHRTASVKLAEVTAKVGQRAFIGKVNMNQNSPDYYIEDTEESVRETIQFVEEVQGMGNPLVQPIVTPRFAPSTDMTLMKRLAKIAADYQLPVQSHLSENRGEVSWIKSLYPQCASYTEVYEEAGLLGANTVMAHCVYLSDGEIDLLKQRDCGVSHCPNSNISLTSGLCDVRRLLSAGVKVGLGTDCSGGYSASILDSIRYAAGTSKILKMGKDESYTPVDHRDLFYLATLGGSEVLGLDTKVGNFEVGKEFDALRIDPCVSDSPFDLFDCDTTDDVIQKFLYLGDDRNITQVYVSGRCVHDRANNTSNMAE